MLEYIAGRHAVYNVLLAGRRNIHKLFFSGKQGDDESLAILNLAKQKGVPIIQKEKGHLQNLSDVDRHQGFVIETGPYPYVDADELALSPKFGFLLILDQIEDPQHVGALARTAHCFGVDGIILSEKGAAGVTPAVVRASAGAVEHIPVAKKNSVAFFLNVIKGSNFWIYGAEAGAEQKVFELEFAPKVALVIGSEGRGLRRLVKERCDFLVSIPITGKVNSLSAGVAGAVLMYEVLRQRNLKK